MQLPLEQLVETTSLSIYTEVSKLLIKGMLSDVAFLWGKELIWSLVVHQINPEQYLEMNWSSSYKVES